MPPRRDRHNPRAVKRKMSNYRLKRATDLNPPTPRPISDAIRILGGAN